MLFDALRARSHRLLNAAINSAWRRVRHRGAIGPKTVDGERFASFGDGSVIAFPPSTIYGERGIHIGRDTMIGPWCTISAGYSPDQSSLPDRTLVIGDRSVIGTRSGIVAHESIEIGDDVWFGQEIYVTDANHGYQDPTTPIGRQLGAHDPVRIGDGTWIGHGSVVLPGTTIGRNVVVAAGSIVRGDFPDHAVIGGVPAKVIRAFEPGVGWVRPDGRGSPKPIEAPLDLEALARDLELLEKLGPNATNEALEAARERARRAEVERAEDDMTDSTIDPVDGSDGVVDERVDAPVAPDMPAEGESGDAPWRDGSEHAGSA